MVKTCLGDNRLLIIGSGIAGGMTLICCVTIAIFIGTLLILHRSCKKGSSHHSNKIILKLLFLGKANAQALSGSKDCDSHNGGDYEEIPGNKYVEHVEQEEGYVSIIAPGKVDRNVIPPEPAQYAMVKSYLLKLYIIMYVCR